MVKPKKPEIGVWKIVEAKGCKKHQKEKLKPIHRKLPAKSKRQINVNDASRPKNFKQPKFASKQKFHEQNRQWSNPHISMPFSSYGAPLHVPWEFYFNMHYPYLPWSYNSYMSFLLDIFVQIILYITNRQLKSLSCLLDIRICRFF